MIRFWTYSRKCNATITALGGSCQFSDVVVDELSSRRLHDTPSVGGGVVWLAFAEGNTLSHCVLGDRASEMVRYSISGGTDIRWAVLDTALARCC
jgi:hypothetical protein